MRLSKKSMLGSTVVTVLMSAGTGNAQVLEEVVVTAQKRVESLQDVPLAVTAFSAEQLENFGVSDTTDLMAITPGLNVTVAAGGFVQPRIRGVGTSSNAAGVENPVATYIDGVYIGSLAGAQLNLNDIEQVTVLRGPQGTLFGRNATGGLIQVTTLQPDQETAMEAEVSYGNLQTSGANVYLNGPLSDNVAANVSLLFQDQGDGFGTNLANGEDVNRSETFAGRAKIKLDSENGTLITLSGDYSETKGDLPVLRVAPGSFDRQGMPFQGDFYDVDLNFDPDLRVVQKGVSLKLVQEIGQLEFQSISAWRETTYESHLDYDMVSLPYLNVDINLKDEQFTQEFQLQNVDPDKLTWTLGLYFLDGFSAYDPVSNTGTDIPFGATGELDSRLDVRSIAAYGQATYAITDATNVTAGLRYTSDRRKADITRDLVLTDGTVINGGKTKDSKTFDNPSWRLSVDHQFSEELMAYASYNRGFKAGSFVAQAFPAEVTDPETLDAYEVGIKTDFWDQRVRLNLAGFYYDYENIQVQLINQGLITAYNGDGAESYGMEAELTLVLGDLTLYSGASWLHARYTDFENALLTTPRVPTFPPPAFGLNGGNIISTADAKGNRVQGSPDWTVNIGADYLIPTDIGDFILSATYFYNDGWYADPDNRLEQDAYNLLNAVVTWNSTDGGRLYARLWVRNLTDEEYADFLGAADVGDAMSAAPGMNYGATLGMRL